ncbi:MAG: hypothetical protein ACOZE5_01670 [Verrucomicrobiota bacterium]
MKRCRLPRWLAALALPALLPWAQATTVIAPDFDELANSADYVVRATVKSMTSEWRPNPDNPKHPYIGTRVELEVHEVIKGNPPSPLVLDLVGGRIGDEELTISGAPKFVVGQENILFVRGNGRQIVPLVGMTHGQYLVRRDQATGKAFVMRSNGRYLYSTDEVALPESASSAVPARNPHAAPLTVADFAARIRSVIRNPEDTRERLD